MVKLLDPFDKPFAKADPFVVSLKSVLPRSNLRCSVHAVILAFLGALAGCGGGESNQSRLKKILPDAEATTKVSGQVRVDGEPVKDLWVTLHPMDADQTIRPRAQTDTQGNFETTTYIKGDGAPVGDYRITIEWLSPSHRSKQKWIGPDKLKNRYNDPKTTPFEVSVEFTPLKLPPFELKLEGVQEKPASKDVSP